MPTQIQLFGYKSYMKALKVAAKVIPMPKPTLFTGVGSSIELCEAISLIGIKKLLLVTDESIVRLGLLKPIQQALQDRGVEMAIFSQVQPDPTYLQVEAGLRIYLRCECDGILAVGGGSPIDTAKVIAAKVHNPKPIHKLAGLFRVWKTPAPLFAIPTTAGTGSEVTIAAVVSDPDSHQKTPLIDPKLVPMMAALDPSIMAGLPRPITAATGMDALTHAIESYLSMNATSETNGYALAAVKLVMTNLPLAYENGENLVARQNMAIASYYAGLAFTKASLGYVHAISHNLGALYGVPHGLANAIVLPYVLDFSQHATQPQLAELFRATSNSNEEMSESEQAQAFIQLVRQLQQQLKIPATLDMLVENDISHLTKLALKEAHHNYPVPVYMGKKQCEQLLRSMMTPATVMDEALPEPK